MIERWLPIAGYFGFYEVSDLGRIRSIPRFVFHSERNGMMMVPERFIAIRHNPRGYLFVGLSKNGVIRLARVHRLVLETFHPRRIKNSVVNHKNFNQHDNALRNLEWVTQKENIHHAMRHGQFHKSRRKNHGYR